MKFNLSFSNVPLVNLRLEFATLIHWIFFEKSLENPPYQGFPVQIPPFGGHFDLGELLGLHLQRSISGLESYVPCGLRWTSIKKNGIEETSWGDFNKPHSFGRGSTVKIYYHLMPCSIDEELSLQSFDPDLYARTMAFYKQVRNPLFHGRQLQNVKIQDIRRCFLQIAELYRWIDWVYPLDQLCSGGERLGGLYDKYVGLEDGNQ